MKKPRKFLVTWDEYHECCATVEATSKEEAEEKWSNGEYTDLSDGVESVDNVDVCRA